MTREARIFRDPAYLEVLIDILTRHGCIHVCPNEWNSTPRNTTPLVRDLDRDVLAPLNHDHFDRGVSTTAPAQGRVFDNPVFVLCPEPLYNSSERILEQFEDDMG